MTIEIKSFDECKKSIKEQVFLAFKNMSNEDDLKDKVYIQFHKNASDREKERAKQLAISFAHDFGHELELSGDKSDEPQKMKIETRVESE